MKKQFIQFGVIVVVLVVCIVGYFVMSSHFDKKEKKEEEARIGITLSKKIGHAVDRNLYKRQIRMMCQELVDFKQYPYDIILIVRFGYRDNNYQTNKNNLEKLLIKATIK